ncbi:KOW domain-containing RNA-binding protein [Anaerocolumna xylanovorans]|uniref:Ribosomal protein L14E/L6E/L27E n=1 Tax=Anaerocolumna xylanovorans DSM 12503 TaxID=1121345 RepID=A0A1M7Y7G2_9FIRM|nr:hypothetical protein [Anaerocolumna xylanovorans]SHO48554.1 hypothetical protein SAMN02745217_01901 [Anaerocolumna xylanovorans DSM 12503]
MKYLTGKGAVSTAGHDIGKCYVIYREELEYVYLVDGTARTLNNPKKKNKKHMKLIEGVENLLPWMNDEKITTRNEDIKRAIKTYSKIAKGELSL